MPADPDLNTVCLSGALVRMPDYAAPWTFCELKVVQPGGGVLFLPLHVPTATYLRVLEDLSPGDKLSVSGELAYAKAEGLPRGGQTCVKVKALRRLDTAGRVLPEASVADCNPYGHPTPRPRRASLAVKRR
jgi:hypothetical protein